MNWKLQIPASFCIGLLCALLIFSSCSNTKYLQKSQALLTSNKVKIKGELLLSEKEDIKNNLNSSSIILQQPNYKTAKLARIGLYLYNRYDSSRASSKFLGWLINKSWLKPPVIYDSSKARQTVENMEDYLNNQGYYHASASYSAKIKKQKAAVTYHVNTGQVFLMDSISYEIPDSNIRRIVLGSQEYSLLHQNESFSVEKLSDERDRIAALLNDSGYYKFSIDNVAFELDTTNKEFFRSSINPFENILNVFNAAKKRLHPILDIAVKISRGDDSLAFQQFKINDIFIYPDYSIDAPRNDSTLTVRDLKNFTLLYHRDLFKPRVLSRALFFKKGDLYSLANYNATISKLNALGEWKFVTVQFHQINDSVPSLNAYLYLVPNKKQSVGVGVEVTSNEYSLGTSSLGSSLSLTYQNKNVNRAANVLTVSLKGGIESSDTAHTIFLEAKDFNGQINLSFPRFIIPWKIKNLSKFANAKTDLNVGFDYIDRIDLFRFQNYYGSFGYQWNATPTTSWIVKPFFLGYNKYSNFSAPFQAELDSSQYLRNSFQSVFFEGENISFIYNNQNVLHPKHFHYFRVNFEESGLLLKGIDGLLKGASGGKTDFEKITSLRYSNYIKVDGEYKHYHIQPHSSLVSRLYAGVAIPMAGSQAVPYIKQFYAGGPNSMRAWRLRTLGPGSYKSPYSPSRSLFVDQTGEMKLEGNLEYRFDIFQLFGGVSYLRGAIFTDAGNIWNIRNDANKPGAVFKINSLYQDIAVGSGVGLRLDFSYFLIRLDVAFPMKDPSVFDNHGWIPYGIKPFDKQWRKSYLVYNFAVGYPF